MFGLRKITLVARFGNSRRYRRTLDGTHVVELILEFFEPSLSDK